jgi:hypothetical protein
MLDHLVSWLADTRASGVIRNVTWVIPAVQTLHILAISAVVSAVMLIHLRSLRLAVRGEPRADVARRFAPIIWYGTLVLLVTGVILIVGEPHRELVNPVFQIKMVLLIVALALTAVFQRFMQVDPLYWDHTHARRAAAAMLSVVSLAVWIGIVFAGRWIAYADVT